MWIRDNNLTRWYLCDAQGTVRQLVDAHGAVKDIYHFDAWGNLLDGSLEHTHNHFRYVGEEGYYTDIDTGLLLLGVRYYDPEIGRFITPDPVELAGGDLNLYQYCNSNPVENSDPDGMHPNHLQYFVTPNPMTGQYQPGFNTQLYMAHGSPHAEDFDADQARQMVGMLGMWPVVGPFIDAAKQ